LNAEKITVNQTLKKIQNFTDFQPFLFHFIILFCSCWMWCDETGDVDGDKEGEKREIYFCLSGWVEHHF
jgi:hypothetical protein